MKYFTKEELEEIVARLLDSPTRETLKELSDKYNGLGEIMKDTPSVIPNTSSALKVVEPIPNIVKQTPVNPALGLEIPSIDMGKGNNVIGPTIEVPSVPKMEVPVNDNNLNKGPISFTGNLWEPQVPNMNNLMQTTDNFNMPASSSVSTEVPVTNNTFFGPSQNPVDNPIPISGNKVVQQGPTMFGQMQSSYGNAA